MRVIGIACLVVLAIVVLLVLNAGGWFASRTVQVMQNELDPVVLQQKYEWFKDAAAQADAKRASLGVYEHKLARVKALTNLDRTDREQLMTWEQEYAGVKLSYNDLAAEYNAQMAKWNWRFCNRGTLPAGATETLPREFKPYIGE